LTARDRREPGRRALRTAMFALGALSFAPAASAQIRVAPRVGVEISPARRWTISAYERFVHGARIASTGRAQTFVGANFEPLKFLDFGVGYRISGETYRAAYWTSHRLQTDAAIAGSWRGFRLSYRLRWQNRWSPDRSGYEFDSFLRNRVQLRYRTPKPVDLSVSGELYSQLSPALIAADAFRFEAEITGHVDPVDLSFGYRFHGPILGGGQHYHMIMMSVTWRWEAPRRDSQRRRESDPTRPRRERRRR
jgi:hypothetical protein